MKEKASKKRARTRSLDGIPYTLASPNRVAILQNPVIVPQIPNELIEAACITSHYIAALQQNFANVQEVLREWRSSSLAVCSMALGIHNGNPLSSNPSSISRPATIATEMNKLQTKPISNGLNYNNNVNNDLNEISLVSVMTENNSSSKMSNHEINVNLSNSMPIARNISDRNNNSSLNKDTSKLNTAGLVTTVGNKNNPTPTSTNSMTSVNKKSNAIKINTLKPETTNCNSNKKCNKSAAGLKSAGTTSSHFNNNNKITPENCNSSQILKISSQRATDVSLTTEADAEVTEPTATVNQCVIIDSIAGCSKLVVGTSNILHNRNKKNSLNKDTSNLNTNGLATTVGNKNNPTPTSSNSMTSVNNTVNKKSNAIKINTLTPGTTTCNSNKKFNNSPAGLKSSENRSSHFNNMKKITPEDSNSSQTVKMNSQRATDLMSSETTVAPINSSNMNLKASTSSQAFQTDSKESSQRGCLLPVVREAKEILKSVRVHRVVLIAGSKGCGKSSQVAQILLDDEIRSGRSSTCRIVCAKASDHDATSLAEYVALQRNEQLGKSVSVQVKKVSNTSRQAPSILFCTYDVLLHEMRADVFLRKTTILIFDDINTTNTKMKQILERLKYVLKMRRFDFKIILLSFTIWEGSFYDYFGRYHVLYIQEADTVLNLTSYAFPNNNVVTIDLTESDDGVSVQKEPWINMLRNNRKQGHKQTKISPRTVKRLHAQNSRTILVNTTTKQLKSESETLIKHEVKIETLECKTEKQ